MHNFHSLWAWTGSVNYIFSPTPTLSHLHIRSIERGKCHYKSRNLDSCSSVAGVSVCWPASTRIELSWVSVYACMGTNTRRTEDRYLGNTMHFFIGYFHVYPFLTLQKCKQSDNCFFQAARSCSGTSLSQFVLLDIAR